MHKIISLLILCTLLATPLCTAQTTTPRPHTTHVNTPVWTEGDYWTYTIDNLTVNIQQDNMTLYLYLSVGNFTERVISHTDTAYQVQIDPTTIEGTFKINTDLGDGPVNISGVLRRTTLQGSMDIKKTNLGIEAMNLELKGKLIANIYNQPYIPNLPNRITFSMTMKLDVAFTNAYATLDFPMDVGNLWGLPASKITLSGTIDSPQFKMVNFINNFARNFGLIPVLGNLFGMTPDEAQHTSDILADLLPTVDIAHALQEYGGGNTFNVSETPYVFACLDTESLTVPAGTYTAYNITAFYGLGYLYYAPAAGHVIKTEGAFADISSNLISNINMELVDTNFQQ